MIRKLLNAILRLPGLLIIGPGLLLIGMVRIYQIAISPLLGNNCRFHPTCSAYFILAVKKHGAVRGSLKGVYRVLRCHPWNEGGEDYP